MQQLWISGAASRGTGAGTLDVVDPATEQVVETATAATAADVDRAVDAAAAALRRWRRLPVPDRAELVRRIGEVINDNREELARLLTVESGKPLRDSLGELAVASGTFGYYASLVQHEAGRLVAPGHPDQLDLVLHEPYGVTGCIIPWNFPIQLLAWKMAPALATGNTIVALPSPRTPLATLRLAELTADLLPPGVFNVVTGDGPEAGEALVRHPAVPHIAFTGSVPVGRQVAATAGSLLKKVTLELGGKDALVVGPDIELSMAVPATAFAALLNAGQCCTSTERVFVPRNRIADFGEALTEHVRGWRLGPGVDPDTDLGPLISADAVAHVAGHVDQAVAGGARLLTGGSRPTRPDRGYFYEPTVLTDAPAGGPLLTGETFGPVIPLIAYDDFDEAIERTNDSEFGLAATLLSRDATLVKRFMEGVEAGTVYVNDPLTPNWAAPFGGMKVSGLGRELGAEGLDEFRQAKHIHWDIVGAAKPGWRPYRRSDR